MVKKSPNSVTLSNENNEIYIWKRKSANNWDWDWVLTLNGNDLCLFKTRKAAKKVADLIINQPTTSA